MNRLSPFHEDRTWIRCNRSAMRSLFIFMLCLGVAGPALADASVTLEIKNGLASDTLVPGSGAISFSNSLTQGPASAQGSANLSSGILRSSAVAPPTGTLTYPPYYSYANSEIRDTLTFGAGASGTAFLDYHFHGTMSGYGGYVYSTAHLSFYESENFQTTSANHILTNGNCAAYNNPTSCLDGTSIDQYGTFAFAIAPGQIYLQIDLLAYPENGAAADFSNTASLFLRLPTGVTYTSASGQFLATAVPVSAVPELGTLPLLLSSLGVMGVMLRRRAKVLVRRATS